MKTLQEKIEAAIAANQPATIESWYLKGSEGCYRLAFRPEGQEVTCGNSGYFEDEAVLVYGFEAQPDWDSDYFHARYPVSLAGIREFLEDLENEGD